MNIKELINTCKDKNSLILKMKENLISENMDDINEAIEEKIIELKSEIRESAVKEVCGEKYLKLLEEETKNNRYINLLNNMVDEEGFLDLLLSSDNEEDTSEGDE